MTYIGAPWRARFLRAPKFAHELAARTDFATLGDLAVVQLGLKTGADDFFFVRSSKPVAKRSLPLHQRERLPRLVSVVGLDGWQGEIAMADLLSAVLNPHTLFRDDARRFTIPRDTQIFYVFPRNRTPTGDLAEYVALAERMAIHRRKLVEANGSDRWYRQARAVVTSKLVLPYNSAYDYGSWENPYGAVLNGRFVGVTPRGDMDCELLSAMLNSTAVILTRLLVGVSTGTEAALDVGPPAVRKLRVPNLNAAQESHRRLVVEALASLRIGDAIPPGPSRRGEVSRMRHNLDLAIFRALGMTKGEASVVAGRCYQSYARWRTAVEDVEDRMQVNRSAMRRHGQSRGERPLDAVARLVWQEIAHSAQLLPSALLDESDDLEVVEVASAVRADPQQDLFGQGLLAGPQGSIVNLHAHDRVRYAAMLSALGFGAQLAIPRNPSRAAAIVARYDDIRRHVRIKAREHAAAYVGDAASDTVAAAVERLWSRACVVAGMRAIGHRDNLDASTQSYAPV